MLVQQVLEFINQLKKIKLTDFDQSNFEQISKRFSALEPKLMLTADDGDFLSALYEVRWKLIRDTPHDYRVNPLINKLWIEFAGKLEVEKKISYLHILMPSLDLKEIPKSLTPPEEQEIAYEELCAILVALLTYHFDFVLFNGPRISAWDLANNIPLELLGLYEEIMELVKIKKRGDYKAGYAGIVEGVIEQKILDTGWFHRKGATFNLLISIKNRTFLDIGAYWFNSEVILSELLNFHTSSAELQNHIDLFMDALINTHVADNTDFMKKLRVNILFSKLLSEFSQSDRQILINSINHCNAMNAQAKFISNCAVHIQKKLESMGYLSLPPHKVEPGLFQPAQKFKIPADLTNFQELIVFYENLEKKHQKPEVVALINKYIARLAAPILTLRVGSEESNPSDNELAGSYPGSS